MSQSLTVELLLFPQFVFLFCDIFLCTLLKKLKEHIESTSNLNGEKIMLDVYTDMGTLGNVLGTKGSHIILWK